jgi:hypothetical protein
VIVCLMAVDGIGMLATEITVEYHADFPYLFSPDHCPTQVFQALFRARRPVHQSPSRVYFHVTEWAGPQEVV